MLPVNLSPDMDYNKLLPLAVVAVVLLSGCLTGVDADEVRDSSVNAMQDVETYGFETEMDMTMEGDGPGALSVSMEGEGAVDEGERAMEMFMTTSMMGFEIGQDAYIVDDTMYMKMDLGMGADEVEDEWLKIEDDVMVAETWNSSAHAEQYREILEISEVSYDDDASVDGEDAYVLELEPEIDAYNELVEEQMEGMMASDAMGVDEEEMFDTDAIEVESVSMRQWISQDTDYILRSEEEVTMTMSFGMGDELDDELGMDDEFTVTMEADTTFSDHGEDVDIVLPDGAEDAESIDEFGAFVDEDSATENVSDSAVAPESDGEFDTDWADDIPEDPEIDEEDDLIADIDVEVHEFDGAPDTYWATVNFEDVEGDWLRIESVEADGHSQVNSPGATDHLGVDVSPEGDEIVATLQREDGTVVEDRETYEP